MSKVLNIFDFDNTFFDSPTPRTSIWSEAERKELLSHWTTGGIGWYQNIRTLDERYMSYDRVIPETVEAVHESMADPNAITAMLTGRIPVFIMPITEITSRHKCQFDIFGFKPLNTGELTEEIKPVKIKKWIEMFGADRVKIWEDRPNHAELFKNMFVEMSIEHEIVLVPERDSVVDSVVLEMELVDLLRKDREANKLPMI